MTRWRATPGPPAGHLRTRPSEEITDYLAGRRRPDERYFLGFFMTGPYQDSLANDHNLFWPGDGNLATGGTAPLSADARRDAGVVSVVDVV